MKKYQKIIYTLFMAFSATGLSAQKLDAYNLVLPDTVFVGEVLSTSILSQPPVPTLPNLHLPISSGKHICFRCRLKIMGN